MPEKIDGYLTCWVTVREDGTLGIILPDADAMPERFRDRLKEVATKVEGVNSDTYNLPTHGSVWFREWHWKERSEAAIPK